MEFFVAVFQLIFSPLGYPGIAIGPFILNMYTASAFTANAMIVLALLFIIFVFSEQYNHIVNEEKFDKSWIGSPYSMIVFKWTRSQTARYNSALVSATGILGFAFLAFYVWTKIGRRLDNRIAPLGNIASESVGCPPSFKWCGSTPAINVYVYNTLYVFLFGIAFPLINVHLAALFCSIVGPRRQGTMQGVNILISSFSRAVGPLIIIQLFNGYGPKIVWLIEIAILTFTLLPFFFMYKRMVPLKTV
uniref:Major facilitator superfamily (MFS) profile domain-containing protein n=1 Tax=Parascaris equorum TaxID=6256 RepID=A0A914RVD3_PAREQ